LQRIKSVGAHLWLTPHAHQSDEVGWNGRTSNGRDVMVRAALCEVRTIPITRVKRCRDSQVSRLRSLDQQKIWYVPRFQ
jgi:hypothetical protein